MIAIQRKFSVSAKPEMDNAIRAILDESYVDIIDISYKSFRVNGILYTRVIFDCLTNEERFKFAIDKLDDDEGIHAIVTY